MSRTFGLENKKTIVPQPTQKEEPKTIADVEKAVTSIKEEPPKFGNKSTETPPTTKEAKTFGEPCSPELKACVDALIADGKSEESAWAICRSKIGETVTLREGKTEPLTFKPIAFEPFDAVLMETHDEMRAAKIIKQQREINEAFNNISSKVNEVIAESNKPVKVTFPPKPEPYNDKPLKEAILNLPKDDTSWSQKIEEAEKRVKVHAEDMFNTVPKDDVSWKEMFEKMPKDDVTWQPLLKDLKEAFDKLTVEMPKIREEINAKLTATEAKIDTGDKEVLAAFEKAKKGFEKLLELADNTVKEDREKIKTLEVRLKEQDEKKVKEFKETTDLKEELAELKRRTDNVEDKVRPSFKGKQKDDKHESPVTGDPMRGA